MSSEIRKTDDYFHNSEKELEWRESYYFNFVDHDIRTSGFTTIGILPNQKKAEYVLALFYDEKQMLYFKERELATDERSENRLSDENLTFSLIEPLKKWEVDFSNQDAELRIQWEARFPPFNFGRGSGTSWRGHFEQSGTINGKAKFRNEKEIQIKGYGQRDKSWGQRNWHIESWFAFHAQFEKYAIGIRRDMVRGVPYVSGGRSSTRSQIAAAKVDFEIVHGERENKDPVGALTTVHYADGKTETIQSRLISSKSFVSFSRSFSEGKTELFEGMATHNCLTTGKKGTGLIEFLFTNPEFHAGPLSNNLLRYLEG